MHLSFLKPLYDRPGPWASVYLDTSRDTNYGWPQRRLHWGAVADELLLAGCDAATVTSLAQAIGDQPLAPGSDGLAAFASNGDVALVEPLPHPPARSSATVGPLPHVMPLLSQRGEQVPWVRVVVDHTGADLAGAASGGVPRTATVTGTEFPVHKAQPGGWSQPRYQRYAELTWQRHAAEVAAAVVELAEETGADVLVVAGDPQSRPLLLDRLPPLWRRRAVPVDLGSRGVGADPQPLDDVTQQVIAQAAAAGTAEVVDRYRSQNDPDATSGLPSAVAALQRAQVDTMLLVDDASFSSTLWVGPEPTHLAVNADDLRAMGVQRPQRARADAALARAVAGTDAELVLVDPAELADDELRHTGLGVVLRYPNSTVDAVAGGGPNGGPQAQ